MGVNDGGEPDPDCIRLHPDAHLRKAGCQPPTQSATPHWSSGCSRIEHSAVSWHAASWAEQSRHNRPWLERMLTIYIDADACPVKNEIYRVARRYGVRVAV